MRRNARHLLAGLGLAAAGVGCGGGSPVQATSTPAVITVQVSAGGPVSGATVTVYAISDATGQVNNSAGAGGVLGSAGPTDDAGQVTVSIRPSSGPVQVVAGGPALSYPDPTAPAGPQGLAPSVQVPAAFLFTSFVSQVKPGAPVPLTLFTTLADHAALAYARGLHSTHPAKTTISEALATRDPLFVTHITRTVAAWDPTSLRSTVPAPLTAGPQSLVDSAFAAIFDVALNQLARDTSTRAGYGSGAGGLTATTLLQLLEDDIDADGRLDGLTFGGRTVATPGATPVVMDAQFLRHPLAVALAGWSRNGQVNKSGISDADLVGAQVFRSMVEDNSDLFGSAPTLPFDPLDRTPPALTMSAPPSQYTSSSVIRLSLTAQDPSGVKAVYALVGATRHQGQLVDGAWQVEVALPAVGHNGITLWAEDLAEPATNTGLGAGPPYEQELDVTFDPDPPQAVFDGSFASYADERSATVQAGVDGLAKVPAAYVVGPKGAIQNGADVYKVATRLGAGGPLDAAELESTNAANIPVLRFSVPFNPRTDAPITRAAFTVTPSCPGCGSLPVATGQLLASPSDGAQALLFDLPLSLETVPALGQLQGPATLSVALDLADAAGNSATIGGFGVTFHVIGGPLSIVEDVAYPGYGDPRSTFPYRLGGMTSGVDTYSTLFDPSSPAFYGGQVRLVRYLVSNPAPTPVAFRPAFLQAPSGSWKVTETWLRRSWVDQPTQFPRNGPSTSTTRVIDGFTFYQSLYWALPYGTLGARLARSETAAHPCGNPPVGTPAHRVGDSASRWTCLADSIWNTPTVGSFASAPVTPVVFAGPQQGGGEVVPPTTDTAGTSLIVPAAAGASPGSVVIYLTRPIAAGRTRPLHMNLLGNANTYETYDYEVASPFEVWTTTTTTGQASYMVHVLFRSGEYLESTAETVEGSLSLTTQGFGLAGLFGEPGLPVTIPFSRTVSTH